MSSNTSSSSSIHEGRVDFLLRRYTWHYEKLLESFSRRYQLNTSGSLSDALIKVAKDILNNEPNDEIKSWAESLVTTTKVSISFECHCCKRCPLRLCLTWISHIFQSDVFRNWYRNQKPRQPEKIIDRAGRQHAKQVVEQVSKSYSSVTSAIGRSARSQLPALPSSTSTVIPSKRGREETLTSDQQGDKQQPTTSFRIDPDNFDLQEYKFRDVDVGNMFLDLQRRSTGLVNQPQERASLFNIHSFL